MSIKNIKKILLDEDLSITDLSQITGYSRGHLSAVIHGRFDSSRAKKVISLALHQNYNEIFKNMDEKP
jgi:DNA-binding transcriptional regulator GbsR (MarR family)